MEHRKKEKNGKVKIRVYIRTEEEENKNKMAIIEFFNSHLSGSRILH